MKYIACVSWGKDSTAMLITLIESNEPLDEVIFYNTGVEFEAIYKVRDKFIKEYLNPKNIKYTELKPKRPFFETMYNHPYKAKSGKIKKGYGWCGGRCRWGTTEKVKAMSKYQNKNTIQYIGIAFDEEKRYKRLQKNKKAPLYEKGITEKQALKICYEHGYDFDGLYKVLDRVSCWCCRNKNLKELKAYKKYLPEYYKKLKELEEIIGEPMKPPKTLKERFEKYEEISLFDFI